MPNQRELKLISDLRSELSELLFFKHTNKELNKRVEDIKFQLESLEGESSLRDHELVSTKRYGSIDTNEVVLDEDKYSDDSYGFVSEGFHDPNKDY